MDVTRPENVCRHQQPAMPIRKQVFRRKLLFFIVLGAATALLTCPLTVLGQDAGGPKPDTGNTEEAATAAKAVAAATAGAQLLASVPYNLEAQADLDALIAAHGAWQADVLQRRTRGVPAVRCMTWQGHGLGNRLPGVITCYAFALMTGRLMLLDSSLHDHLVLPLPAVWSEHESLFAGSGSCNVLHFTRLLDPALRLCGLPDDAPDLQVCMAIHVSLCSPNKQGLCFHCSRTN